MHDACSLIRAMTLTAQILNGTLEGRCTDCPLMNLLLHVHDTLSELNDSKLLHDFSQDFGVDIVHNVCKGCLRFE